MKQFKAQWQSERNAEQALINTVLHLITQHNELIEYLEERSNDPYHEVAEKEHQEYLQTKQDTITLPKPEWWEDKTVQHLHNHKATYLEALSDASKALGVEIRLED